MDKIKALIEKFNDDFHSFLDYVIDESKNIQYIEEAEHWVHPEFDWEDPKDFCFFYLKPLNETGILELRTLAIMSGGQCESSPALTDINKIFCFEMEEENFDNSNLVLVEKINQELIKNYKKLGYQVFIFENNGNILQKIKELAVTLKNKEDDDN